MATTIKLSDVKTALANLMGKRTLPGGTIDDWERYCQYAFDYAWRYYKWSFSLKRAVIVPNGSGISYLPDDFDLDGYRLISGATEIQPEENIGTTSSTRFSIEWDSTASKYLTVPATSFTMIYQTTPPKLSNDNGVPFPSAMTVAVGAAVYAKQAENPTRADISQEYDEFHAELDRHAARANNSRPRRTARNFHDVNGTYTGNVGG